MTLGQVQADELRMRIVGGIVWLAMSISVASRLWLGGAVSATRDCALIRAALTRVRQAATLEAGMWLVGSVYNFVSPHRSLGTRTPAQAAGLTDHQWTIHELLTFPTPLPPVKRRGRPPHWLREIPDAA